MGWREKGKRKKEEGEYQIVKRIRKERERVRGRKSGTEIWKEKEKKGPGIMGAIKEERGTTQRRGRKAKKREDGKKGGREGKEEGRWLGKGKGKVEEG